MAWLETRTAVQDSWFSFPARTDRSFGKLRNLTESMRKVQYCFLVEANDEVDLLSGHDRER